MYIFCTRSHSLGGLPSIGRAVPLHLLQRCTTLQITMMVNTQNKKCDTGRLWRKGFNSIFCYGFIPWVVSQFFFLSVFSSLGHYFFVVCHHDRRTINNSKKTGTNEITHTTNGGRDSAIRTLQQRLRYPERNHKDENTPPKTQKQHTVNNHNN